MDRVKFYSTLDLASGNYLSILEKNIERYKSNTNPSIKDIIEFYNIQQYIKNNMYLSYWNEQFIAELQEFSDSLRVIINKYFNNLSTEEFKSNYYFLGYDEKDDFLKIINENKNLNNKFSNKIEEILKENPNELYYFVYYENIVKRNGNIIKDIILMNSNFAELIINYYHLNSNKKRYIPNELSSEDKINIIENYIDSISPNLNYLRYIPYLKEIKLNAKIILKAKERIKEEESKIFSNRRQSVISSSISLKFVENQEKEVLVTNNGLDSNYLYSLDWIKQNKDYSTLLNNFIYLFGYVDRHMKIEFILKKYETEKLIDILTSSSKYTYNINTTFEFKDKLSLLQLYCYYNTLNQLEIRLEDVVQWFYTFHLLEEFSIENFKVYLPSEGATYREKCTSSFIEIESILKQYELYVEDKEITHELLALSSYSLDFKECSSLLEKKYIYLLEDNSKPVIYLFFSNQCMLSYVSRLKSEYSTFYDLIYNEDITLDDYEGIREKKQIDWLVKNNWILISDKKIIIRNKEKIKILHDLYINESISYWNYPKIYRNIIDELINENLVTYDSSLFSKEEQDYLSYNFNNQKFTNSLALRNKYGHGTNYKGNPNDISYFNDYLYALRLLILITIKINDDLCLYNSPNYIQYIKNKIVKKVE